MSPSLELRARGVDVQEAQRHARLSRQKTPHGVVLWTDLNASHGLYGLTLTTGQRKPTLAGRDHPRSPSYLRASHTTNSYHEGRRSYAQKDDIGDVSAQLLTSLVAALDNRYNLQACDLLAPLCRCWGITANTLVLRKTRRGIPPPGTG